MFFYAFSFEKETEIERERMGESERKGGGSERERKPIRNLHPRSLGITGSNFRSHEYFR